MKQLYEHFERTFREATDGRDPRARRVGAELKFPLVCPDGSAASRTAVDALWKYLAGEGWQPLHDGVSGRVVGATRPGPENDSVASCETGYCKTEFSLAHVADLTELERAVDELLALLRPFAARNEVRFLGYGIQPVTPPGKDLLLKKERASFWDRAVPSNRVIPLAEGDDVHLFTINAGSHVHVSVTADEAVRAVNVLNGFAGAQIALGADSSVWRNSVDPQYQAVGEVLWDLWRPAAGRSGLPLRPFADLADYVTQIAALRPIYVRRNGAPLILHDYGSFAEYYASGAAEGVDLEGRRHAITPGAEDVDLHNSCYWFTARISRYFTVENRAFDQQPRGELLTPAAVTLGLASALDDRKEHTS